MENPGWSRKGKTGTVNDAMEQLVGQLIYIDTNCFIYLLEDHPLFGERACHLFTALENDQFRAITSVLTLMEIMAGPLKLGDKELAAEYAHLLETFPGLTLHAMDRDSAHYAATFRASGIRAPDTIHLATALHHRVNYFITADQRLSKVQSVNVLIFQSL